MSVWLVAASDFAIVGLVGRVDVTVFLAVAGIRETPIATVKLAFERFLTCKEMMRVQGQKMQSHVSKVPPYGLKSCLRLSRKTTIEFDNSSLSKVHPSVWLYSKKVAANETRTYEFEPLHWANFKENESK